MQRKANEIDQKYGELNLDLVRPKEESNDNMISEDGVVGTPSLLKIADDAIYEMQAHTFRHFAVMGEEGCGKMSLVKLMKERAGDDRS